MEDAAAAQFGGVVLCSQAESPVPRVAGELGPSRSDLRAPVSDLGFTFLTGTTQIRPCCAVCVTARGRPQSRTSQLSDGIISDEQ